MVKEEKAVKVTLSGKVQGVGFRSFVKRNARSKGVNGYVKNLPSGEVEAFFQGPRESVNEMIELIKKGPPTSNVDNVEVEEKEPQEFSNFKITH